MVDKHHGATSKKFAPAGGFRGGTENFFFGNLNPKLSNLVPEKVVKTAYFSIFYADVVYFSFSPISGIILKNKHPCILCIYLVSTLNLNFGTLPNYKIYINIYYNRYFTFWFKGQGVTGLYSISSIYQTFIHSDPV